MNCSTSFIFPSLIIGWALSGAAYAASVTHATDQGHGRVNMHGLIIDTPCAIAVESRDQTIDLSTVPVGEIIRDGAGPAISFQIRLVNCLLKPLTPNKPDWSRFQVTFDGAVTDGQLFALNGDARGLGLVIDDPAGHRIVPGVPTRFAALQAGSMNLGYTLRLVSNHQKLRAGAYSTSIRFKLDYY
ncbi:fimbrial protein [Salmonella enterica]